MGPSHIFGWSAGAAISAELRRKLGVLIPAAFVTAGLAAGVAQVLIFRELVVSCQGNEVSMGIMLAAWLLWGALGALSASRSRGSSELASTVRTVAILTFAPGPALVAALLVARSFGWLLTTKVPDLAVRVSQSQGWLAQLVTLEPGQMLNLPQILILSFAATMLPAIVCGAQFAAILRAYAHLRPADPDTVGRAYALDAVGHLLGGTALAWLALQVVPPFAMATAVGIANILVGLLLLSLFAGARLRSVIWILGSVLMLVLLFAGPRGEEVSRRLRWYHHELLASIRTVYGDLAVTRFGENGVYVYNSGLPTASSPAPEFLTVDIDFALLQHPAPRRILMVGGGATGGLAAALRHRPESIACLELDPAVFSFVAPWLAPADRAALNDPRVQAIAGDVRLFVKHQAQLDTAPKYDVILQLMAPPASAQLNRFYTRQWFKQLARLLAPGGIVAWQIPSSQVYLLGPLRSLNATVLTSAQEVFDSLVYLPGEEMTVVAGSVGDYMSNDAEELLARARWRGLESDMLYAWLPDMLRPIFTDYVREQIEAAEHVSINTDQRPLAYFYHQAWWLEHRHPGWGERLSTLAQRPAWQWFAAVAGLLLLWAVISLTGLGQRTVIPTAVAVAGLCGMAGEMVLLLNFQSYYGYVFQQIGLIMGSFMVGLATGSWLLGRWLRQAMPAVGQASRLSPIPTGETPVLPMPPSLSAAAVAHRLAGILASGAALLAVMPYLLTALWTSADSPWAEALVANVAFPILAALFGLWIGAQFPVASHLWAAGRDDRARSASILYAVDLIGAAGGALVAGTLLVPILGTAGTCWLMAMPAAVAALIVLGTSKG